MIHRYVQSAGVRLHYVDDGSGTAVVFLHGIPESSNAWTDYVELLAGAGYHAAAPDLRGYGLSDKPQGVNSYRAELLVEDVATVIRSMGSGTASVVGQSWGGLAAWLFAMRHPEMLDRLVILNVPHPLHWAQALRTWVFWRRNWQISSFSFREFRRPRSEPVTTARCGVLSIVTSAALGASTMRPSKPT